MATAKSDDTKYRNPFVNALAGESRWTAGDTVRYFLDPGGTANAGSYPANWQQAGGGAAFDAAARAWSSVANVTMERTTDRSQATIVETLVDRPTDDILASHELPHNATPRGEFNTGRTDFYTTSYNKPGGVGFLTFLHEIGHALGLDHPFDGKTTFAEIPRIDEAANGYDGFDHAIYTVMSYDDAYHDLYNGDRSLGTAATPMAFDIAAVQAIYGANMTTATGDDIYLLPPNSGAGAYYTCIWDAGGKDTISAAGATAASTIDLAPATLKAGLGGGGYLSAQRIETLGDRGRAPNLPYTQGGFFIAKGVVIENAVGSKYDDLIYGNDADNQLTGGRGDDQIWSGKGHDTLLIGKGDLDGSYDALYDYRSGTDRFDLTALGDKIDCTITSYFGGSSLLISLGKAKLHISLGGTLDPADILPAKGTSLSIKYVFSGSVFDGKGSDGDDHIRGTAAPHRLHGRDGDDFIAGAQWNDTLDGGAGRDQLTGDRGEDTFLFKNGDFAGAKRGEYDLITDFSQKQHDLIDLRGVDAVAATPRDNAFKWIGDAAFGHVAGQLHASFSGPDTIVSGDTDGDGRADFKIQLTGHHVLTAADFIL